MSKPELIKRSGWAFILGGISFATSADPNKFELVFLTILNGKIDALKNAGNNQEYR